MRATTDAWRAQHVLGAYLGVAVSLLVHALAYAVLRWAGTLPAVDFSVELPSHVEFGIAEPPSPEAAPPTLPPSIAPASPQPALADGASPPKPRIKRKTESPDAGVSAAESRVASKRTALETPSIAAQKPTLSAFAPAGAQLALRLQLTQIRDSELADDVRALLDAVPDWRMIVDGSGLDPLRDLERLYLASPDLRRASVVIAGQYAGGDDVPRHAVENLAAARGVTANFRNYGSIPVAPWANADETERVVALIAPHQFAITRPDDLPRVLQVARALARRKQKPDAKTVDPGDALLALDADQVLVFSVEGARLFARGNLDGVPERFEVSVRARTGSGFDVAISGSYESAGAAEKAASYWARMRDRFAGHPLLALIGMRGPVADARIASHATSLDITTEVSVQQARVVLGFVQSALRSSAGDLPSDRTPSSQPRPSHEPERGTSAKPISPPNP